MIKTVTCNCGAELKLEKNINIKKAKCPNCSSILDFDKLNNLPTLEIYKNKYNAQDLFKHVVETIVRISSKDGEGSGLLIDNKGIVVTNKHVINTSYDVNVSLNNKNVYSGKVLRAYKDIDLAFLQIDYTPTMIPEMNNKDITVGEKVYAIGHPHGLDYTLTQGIISSISREINKREYIQTDASINPGNSGGPLFNSYAKVIGINTLGLSIGGGDSGLNFAIPIESVIQKYKKLIPQLDNIINKSYCAYCGINSTNNIYCDNCGTKIKKQINDKKNNKNLKKDDKKNRIKKSSTGKCKNCNYQNLKTDFYCNSCGTKL